VDDFLRYFSGIVTVLMRSKLFYITKILYLNLWLSF